MITSIRNATQSWIVKGVLIILVISFGAWGISDFGPVAGTNPAVAKVGGEELDSMTVEYEIRREVQRLNPQFGNQLTPEISRALGIPQSVLGRLINDILIVEEARGLGVAVSDQRVRDDVLAQPEFQSFLGNQGFNRDQFNSVIRNLGITEEEYLRRVREQLVRAQYLAPLERGVAAPDPLVRALFKHREEQRVAETVFLPFAGALELDAPDEAALRKFHMDNPGAFTAPETRAVTLLTLGVENFSDPSAVSETDIQNAFDARRDGLSVPERRQLRQMILPNKEKADEAVSRLKEGQSFAKVAEDVADMAGDATDLGVLTLLEVAPALRDAAFETREGKFSDPVETSLGWQIVSPVKVEEGREAAIDDVREELRRTIADERAIDELYKVVNTVEDEIGKGASIAEAAGAAGLDVVRIAHISRNGEDRAGRPIPALPANSASIIQAAFETGEGLDSTIRELGDQAFFILSVDGVTAPALRPFEEVREDVVRAWRQREREALTEKRANAALERLKDGSNMEELAIELASAFQLSEPVKRQQRGASLSPAVLNVLFDLTAPNGSAVARGRDGFYLVKLKEIIAADPSRAPETLTAIREEVGQSMVDDVITQIASSLASDMGVDVNENAFLMIVDPELRAERRQSPLGLGN